MGQKRNPFRIIINRPIQIRFSVFVGAIVMISLALVWASMEILMVMLSHQYAADEKVLNALSEAHFYMLYFFFWEGLLAVGAAVLLTLLFSRRVVGPIYRIQTALSYFLSHRSLQGSEFRLRDNDEFQDLGELVNKVVEELQDEELMDNTIEEEQTT